VDGDQPPDNYHGAVKDDRYPADRKIDCGSSPRIQRVYEANPCILSLVSQKGEAMNLLVDLADRGLLPDRLIRCRKIPEQSGVGRTLGLP